MMQQLAQRGIAVVDAFLPMPQLVQLQAMAQIQLATAVPAGIGRGGARTVDASIRGDHICWLVSQQGASADYLQTMDQLRLQLNRQLFLGLSRYECQYANYAPGAGYQKHRDAFRGERNRKLSTVLYLNDEWQPQAGGELVIYADDEITVLERVLPQANRLVVFLSEEFPHAVLPATRERRSIAGWFSSQ